MPGEHFWYNFLLAMQTIELESQRARAQRDQGRRAVREQSTRLHNVERFAQFDIDDDLRKRQEAILQKKRAAARRRDGKGSAAPVSASAAWVGKVRWRQRLEFLTCCVRCVNVHLLNAGVFATEDPLRASKLDTTWCACHGCFFC